MNLRSVIANQFTYEYKAYDLEGVCSTNGIEIDSERDTMHSKRLCYF